MILIGSSCDNTRVRKIWTRIARIFFHLSSSAIIFLYIYILMIQIFSGDGMYILNNANEIEN